MVSARRRRRRINRLQGDCIYVIPTALIQSATHRGDPSALNQRESIYLSICLAYLVVKCHHLLRREQVQSFRDRPNDVVVAAQPYLSHSA